MTIYLGAEELERRLGPDLALAAMETAFATEARGATNLPARIDARSGHGFIRVMPAVLDDIMGVKVMTLAEGLGTRYLVLLYETRTGALLALLDADELTRHRTAATTALAARFLCPGPVKRLGLIGSGFEASGQLRALAALWPLEHVDVFSPTESRRTKFASTMSRELSVEIEPVTDARKAVRGHEVVALATKSASPVLEGTEIDADATVLSIGSTRLDLRELDRATFARAACVVGDDPAQLELESGDIADAITADVLERAHLVSLAALVTGAARPARNGARDLLVFKSVGTALQDLALARLLYEDACRNGYGTELGELSQLKAFASGS